MSFSSFAARLRSAPRSTRSRADPFAEWASAADLKQRVAKRRPDGKSADDIRIDTIAVILLLAGDRASNQGSTRSAFDPGDLAPRPALPAKHGRAAHWRRRVRLAAGLLNGAQALPT